MCKFEFWLVSNGDIVQTKGDFYCRKHTKCLYKFGENDREKIVKKVENLPTFHGSERKIVPYLIPRDCG